MNTRTLALALLLVMCAGDAMAQTDSSQSGDQPFMFGADTRKWDSATRANWRAHRAYMHDSLDFALNQEDLERSTQYLKVLLSYLADTNYVRTYGKDKCDSLVKTTEDEIRNAKVNIEALYRTRVLGPWKLPD